VDSTNGRSYDQSGVPERSNREADVGQQRQRSWAGVQAASDKNDVRSPEPYIGYARAQHFVSPGGIKLEAEQFSTVPNQLRLSERGLAGRCVDHGQVAVLKSARGKIIFRFPCP
jgi:hypothetical protein